MSKPSKQKVTRARHVLVEALKAQGVEYVFGILGYPIIEFGMAVQSGGLKYIGMRNEQAASYAAGAIGYLTGKPAALIVVPGPGVVHALAGMGNSTANGWPLICIGGASELEQDGLGAFQESLMPMGGAQIQQQYAVPYCKYVVKATDPMRLPFFVEQAMRFATSGRPGAVYIEIGGDTLREEITDNVVLPPKYTPAPPSVAPQEAVARALKCLQEAKSPLLIVGKGAALSGASPELRELVEKTKIQFLPTPMGKGVLPDDHPLCSSSARSAVLKNADVVLLVGARLNWILHYGRPPRYRADVKFLHVEILPEEIGHSVPAEVALVGDAKAITQQLLDALPANANFAGSAEWKGLIAEASQKSKALFKELSEDMSTPMNYYCALNIVDKLIPNDAIIVNEGSDTMDIGRTVLNNYEPKMRLDAGTWGTMGVGMPQAIASALANPNPGCVFVAGDSAFGFSAMEFEVVCRYQLPIIVVIINNNGIGAFNPEGWTSSGESTEERLKYPAKSLTPECHYEGIATALGATGVFVNTPEALEKALSSAVSTVPFKPTIINCMISTYASRGKSSPLPWAKAEAKL